MSEHVTYQCNRCQRRNPTPCILTAPCSWCGRPTEPGQRRYVDRYVTWWICIDCYRATRRAPVPAMPLGSAQNKGGLA